MFLGRMGYHLTQKNTMKKGIKKLFFPKGKQSLDQGTKPSVGARSWHMQGGKVCTGVSNCGFIGFIVMFYMYKKCIGSSTLFTNFRFVEINSIINHFSCIVSNKLGQHHLNYFFLYQFPGGLEIRIQIKELGILHINPILFISQRLNALL